MIQAAPTKAAAVVMTIQNTVLNVWSDEGSA
jgi:hypothetical protein